MLSSRFFWKIFVAFLTIIVVTTASVLYLMSLRNDEAVGKEMARSLDEKLMLFVALLDARMERNPSSSLVAEVKEVTRLAGTRFSIIDANGTVVAESHATKLDNHADRPEVKAAMAGGLGLSRRYSETLQQPMIYAARRATLRGQDYVVRTSQAVRDFHERFTPTIDVIAAGFVFGSLLSVLLAFFLAKRITGPIADISDVAGAISRGNYEARVSQLPRNEIGSLGHAINTLAEAIQENITRREQVEKIRHEFSSNASHELKTPLTSIKGYVETLLAGAIYDKDVNMRFLEIILSNIDRMIALVNDLLRISSMEANSAYLDLQASAWEAVVEDVVHRHDIQMANKNLGLYTELPQEPLRVKGNLMAMSHVLDNLLQNAINYTPAGGHITIRIEKAGDEGFLRVIDTGIGIAEQDQMRIFERFYRVDSGRARSDGGTGLGLAIVKHMVLQMHGRIAVKSALGKGSTFSVALPLA